MQYPLQDPNDLTSWRRMRLFPDAGERTDDRVLDTGMDRTPVAVWSDGTHTFVMGHKSGSHRSRAADRSRCTA
jgi:hypothetical protein